MSDPKPAHPFVVFSRVTRLHTACIEGAAFPLAAFLGGAPVLSLPLFVALGFLAHAGGNGMNSIVDLAYDKVDPSKKDHPLVNGDLRRSVAVAAVLSAVILSILIFVGIAESRGTYWTIPVFAGYAIMGAVYNLYTKRHKPLGVASFALTFTLAFVAMAEVWNYSTAPILLAGALYTAFYSAYMVGIAGEVKDVRQLNEPNLLRDLGATVTPDGWVSFSLRSFALALGIGLLQSVTLTSMAADAGGILWFLVVAFAFGIYMLLYTFDVLQSGATHAHQLKVIGAGSAFGYVLIVLAVAPLMGPWLALVFAIVPFVFFAGMNRLIWPTSGSALAPGV